jgi:hypothetical protein
VTQSRLASWREAGVLLATSVYADVRARPGRTVPTRQSLRPPRLPPLFVVGAPRSGTTFLGACIGAVPSISYHFEPPVVRAALRHAMRGEWTKEFTARVYRLTYRLLRLLDAERPTARVADKTPENAFALPFLVESFPGASFVHIVRDGRDAALSLREKPWLRDDGAGRRSRSAAAGAAARFWVEPERADEFAATSNLHRCLWAWRRYTEAALAGRELGSSYLELRYEDLVRDPRGTGDRLLDFLGLDDGASRTALGRALAGARADSVGRGRSAFSEADTALAGREIGPLLSRLGYGS